MLQKLNISILYFFIHRFIDYVLYFQYLSASWDQTIRVWNAWRQPKPKRRVSKQKKMIGGRNEHVFSKEKDNNENSEDEN